MACTSPVSAAKLFVQLAPARGSQPVLDFLLPRRHVVATASRRALRSSSTAATGVRLIHLGDTSMRAGWRTPAPATALPQRTAPFNSLTAGLPYTPARRYTQAVYNPQKDDEGIEMKLEITPRAAKRLSDIMLKDNNPHLALRIQVESGGCHGFQYLMSLVTLPSSLPQRPADGAEPAEHPGEGADSGIVREDDTILTYSKEEEVAEAEAAAAAAADLMTAPKIILDQPSLELLKGSKVDFTMELIGSQFKIVDNPMATSSCGCGTSFDLKSL